VLFNVCGGASVLAQEPRREPPMLPRGRPLVQRSELYPDVDAPEPAVRQALEPV
jgi:hypothetical protein